MGNPVVHFELHGKDGASLAHFYGDLFGWKTTLHEPIAYRIVDTDSDGTGIAGGIMEMSEGEPFVTFYVAVPDVDAALEQVATLGGATVMPKDAVPGGPTIALFRDPEGNTVGLVERM